MKFSCACILWSNTREWSTHVYLNTRMNPGIELPPPFPVACSLHVRCSLHSVAAGVLTVLGCACGVCPSDCTQWAERSSHGAVHVQCAQANWLRRRFPLAVELHLGTPAHWMLLGDPCAATITHAATDTNRDTVQKQHLQISCAISCTHVVGLGALGCMTRTTSAHTTQRAKYCTYIYCAALTSAVDSRHFVCAVCFTTCTDIMVLRGGVHQLASCSNAHSSVRRGAPQTTPSPTPYSLSSKPNKLTSFDAALQEKQKKSTRPKWVLWPQTPRIMCVVAFQLRRFKCRQFRPLDFLPMSFPTGPNRKDWFWKVTRPMYSFSFVSF